MDAQKKLLRKLNEYGDTFLDTHEVKLKKKKNKHKEISESSINKDIENSNDNLDKTNSETNTDKTNKRKKKRKKKKKSDSNDLNNDKSKPKRNPGGPERHVEQIKKELGLEDFKEEQEMKKLEEEKKQRQLEKLKKKKNEPEIVVFHSRKVKLEDNKGKSKDTVKSDKKGNELDLESARYDVRKLGISASKGEQKEEAMKDLLLRLGAKPPKNKFYNYKEFQEMQRKQKEEHMEQRSWDRTVGNKVKGKEKGGKRKHDRNDVGFVDGQVGKFKSGVLFLNKKDIHGIKKPKTMR